MAKIEKITVERVFNVGNYQTIRFGLEVTPNPEEVSTPEGVKETYNRALYAVENSFNMIMKEKEKQNQQTLNR